MHKLLFLFCDNFENRRFFIAWGFMFVLMFIHEKENWQFFSPPSVTPLSTMLWSRAVMYPERGTLLRYHEGIRLILVKAMWPRVSQWLSPFSWVKVWEYNFALTSGQRKMPFTLKAGGKIKGSRILTNVIFSCWKNLNTRTKIKYVSFSGHVGR